MKSRSITKRNLTGGFFGGIMGIFSFGYIHPCVLPIGCLLGVLGGWWYQEIFQSAIEGWHKGVQKTHDVWNGVILLITTPTKKLKNININFEFPMRVVHFLIFLVFWVFRSPMIFYRWMKKHPMNQVYVLRFLATIASIELTALWMVPLGFKLNHMFEIAKKGNGMDAICVLTLLLGMIVVVCAFTYPVARSDGMYNFYASWSSYSYQGMILFFFREVMANILSQIGTTVIMLGILFWFFAIGGAFLVIIIAPLSFGIGMVKGIYKVAMKPGHWLCLITTLVVTLASALEMHTYFADQRILWAVALTAGVVSAMATEGLRRIVALFCEHSKFIQGVAMTELGTLLSPSNKFFWKTSELLSDKCAQPIVNALYQ